jgi:hypothetical protein
MRSAFNETSIYNLEVIKETKRWFKQDLIQLPQFEAIKEAYKSPLYHPNFIIRIVLFVAALLALSGVSGLCALIISDADESVISVLCILYGALSFFLLENAFIKSSNHFKSGVTEALLYHACAFTIGGICGLSDFDNEHVILLSCVLIFSFAAYRYLDLLTTLAALVSFAGFIFYEFYNLGGIFQKVIPFIFIVCFTPFYFYVRKLKTRIENRIWIYNLIIAEAFCLLMIYSSGNYLVVRELSVELMNLDLEEGHDIPLAFIFYSLTVLIPVGYLYFGIKKKDVVLLRVSLLVIAFTVFTFKYYYSLGHHEITFTIAGAILLLITLGLLNYLKVMRGGFIRENQLPEKWGAANLQGIIFSQTLGGNEVAADAPVGGGESGGAGSTDSF